jgi:hypothetical protein
MKTVTNTKGKTIFIIILVLILIVGITSYVKLSTNTVNSDGTMRANWFDKQKIIDIAKEEILKNLKSPSTAKFPSNKEIVVKVDKDDNSLYVVSMWVDSENSYGAMLRQNVLLQIILKPDKTYKIKDIMFL